MSDELKIKELKNVLCDHLDKLSKFLSCEESDDPEMSDYLMARYLDHYVDYVVVMCKEIQNQILIGNRYYIPVDKDK